MQAQRRTKEIQNKLIIKGRAVIIDYNITLSSLLQLAAMLFGGFYFIWEIKNKLSIMQSAYTRFEDQLKQIEVDVKSLSHAAVTIATQNQRLDTLDGRVVDMKAVIERMSDLFKPIHDVINLIQREKAVLSEKVDTIATMHKERILYTSQIENKVSNLEQMLSNHIAEDKAKNTKPTKRLRG